MNTSAQLTVTEQSALCTNIEAEINKIMNVAMERQKKFARFSEQLSKVHEISKHLTKCHTLLNQTLESLETLNNSLPIEDRLEPFIWTTG